MKKILFASLALLTISCPLLAQSQATLSHGQMFMRQMDADKNGSVSLKEFLKPQEMQFKHMDKDGNGSISEAEADAFAKKMQKRHQQMRQKQAPRR